MSPTRQLTLAALGALIVACSDSSGPAQQRLDVNFLRPALTAPPVANPVVAFYAKKGQDVEAIMWYRKDADRPDSTEFMRFRLQDNSLLARPDGSAFAPGDSVLITITLADPQRLIIDMQPSGLRFSPVKPAELKLSFEEADEDLNEDGVVNEADGAIVGQFAIWKRERPGDPWLKLSSLVEIGTYDVKAFINGFTGYAIAW
ncbi:MAG TPA: hypothetical protein VFT29_16575 [Gemmatimonadaceae bacterium]|nr:hypothetical protein [Gemmatimonadaceae bacterium]